MKRAAIFLIALACTSASTTNATPTTSPSRVAGSAPVIVIVMENHERSDIMTSSSATYLKNFSNAGRVFTHYYAVTHPSLPNYLAMSSGGTDGKQGTDTISAGEIQQKSFWAQLSVRSISWKVYMESMPSACYKGGSSGQYQLKHNPAMTYNDVASKAARCKKVVPFTQFSPTNLPSFSFVVPNMCNDMHDCSIATGNGWLASHVPPMLAAGAIVIITFDEGSSSTNGGGNVYTVVDGPGIAPQTIDNTYNHYSLLAALEQRAGVKKLQNAAGAAVLPIG